MNKRKLTGKWYLRKRILGGYSVMVQVELTIPTYTAFGNGGGDHVIKTMEYQKARREDLIELEIKCV